jgi:hypothetical protein
MGQSTCKRDTVSRIRETCPQQRGQILQRQGGEKEMSWRTGKPGSRGEKTGEEMDLLPPTSCFEHFLFIFFAVLLGV